MPIWPAQPPESTAYAFNRQERARLTIYRAAVAAGFYTDACVGPHELDRDSLWPISSQPISYLSGDGVRSSLRS
jgi:hypothetical protein